VLVIQGGINGTDARRAIKMRHADLEEASAVIAGGMKGYSDRQDASRLLDVQFCEKEHAVLVIQGGINGTDARRAIKMRHADLEEASAVIAGGVKGYSDRKEATILLDVQTFCDIAEAALVIQGGINSTDARRAIQVRLADLEEASAVIAGGVKGHNARHEVNAEHMRQMKEANAIASVQQRAENKVYLRAKKAQVSRLMEACQNFKRFT